MFYKKNGQPDGNGEEPRALKMGPIGEIHI